MDVDMPLMWSLWLTKKGLPTNFTIAWTTLRVAHIPTSPMTVKDFLY